MARAMDTIMIIVKMVMATDVGVGRKGAWRVDDSDSESDDNNNINNSEDRGKKLSVITNKFSYVDKIY